MPEAERLAWASALSIAMCFCLQNCTHATPTAGCNTASESPIHLILPIHVYNRSRVSKGNERKFDCLMFLEQCTAIFLLQLTLFFW
jgi:hypothetical protein